MSIKSTRKATKRTPDKENPAWTREDFAKSVSLSELPRGVQGAIANRRRGPQVSPKKVAVSIRLSPEVVAAFRASGAGWQGRVDEILRAHVGKG
jgi:uncharacterized protein (DUF4415 family)